MKKLCLNNDQKQYNITGYSRTIELTPMNIHNITITFDPNANINDLISTYSNTQLTSITITDDNDDVIYNRILESTSSTVTEFLNNEDFTVQLIIT